MRLFLDSGIIEEAQKCAEWGYVSGITTNPILLSKSSLSPERTLKILGNIINGPIFYQLTGLTIKAMKEEAKLAAEILGKQLVLKIPATPLGFTATSRLSEKYACAVTAIFTPAQALVAHSAGANFALYYHNRAKRLLDDGDQLAQKIVHVLKGTDTITVAASLKSPEEVVEAREAGVSILSTTLKVLEEMMRNDLSDSAVEDFRINGTGLLSARKGEIK